MVNFIYRCYYILFLFYSNYKKEKPWLHAMYVLTASLTVLFIFLLHLSEWGDFFNSLLVKEGVIARQIKTILFLAIPLLILSWFVANYVVFNLAKASKEDGFSERFSFTPTLSDKITCWSAIALPLLLATVPTIIKKLLAE